MKKKLLFSISVAPIMAVTLLVGCGIFKHTTQYTKNDYPKLVDTSTVTKGGVSITLSEIELNEYFKPEYAVEYVSSRSKDGYTHTRKAVINLFWGLTAYMVEIANNTGNVLSLQDSRIALVLPNAPEPIFALSKQEVVDLSKSGELPCIKFELQQLVRRYPSAVTEKTLKGVGEWEGVEDNLQAEVTKMVREKAITSRSSEILPGMKLKGWIVFPYDAGKVKEDAIISFIDVQSSTNEAGATTLKSRFDFRVTPATLYAKRVYDETQGKYSQFISITEDEYTISQQPKSKK
jgi:hypothetical protein